MASILESSCSVDRAEETTQASLDVLGFVLLLLLFWFACFVCIGVFGAEFHLFRYLSGERFGREPTEVYN